MADNFAGNPEDPSVGNVLWRLLANPYDTFILRWNWKAALLSAGVRAPMFLLVTMNHGWRRASVAMFAEAAFRAGITGFFGAATQSLRNAKPQWMALLLMLTGFPLITLALDALLHFAMRTPNLAVGMIASSILSVLASMFDLHIMRRGTMLVGDEGNSFWSDLKALPPLAMSFLLGPPVWAWRSTRQWFVGSEAE